MRRQRRWRATGAASCGAPLLVGIRGTMADILATLKKATDMLQDQKQLELVSWLLLKRPSSAIPLGYLKESHGRAHARR